MLERMIGALRLNAHTFEEVEADSKATLQAVGVVIIVAIASGIGSLTRGDNPIQGLIGGIILGLLTWAVWAFITFIIGTTIFKTPQTQANWGQLARTIGFAQSPGIFKVLGIIPAIGPFLIFLVTVWQLVAMVIAVRQALDYESTWRALGVVIVGAVVVFAMIVVFGLIIGGGAFLASGAAGQ